jgi:hypothetical protein
VRIKWIIKGWIRKWSDNGTGNGTWIKVTTKKCRRVSENGQKMEEGT